MNASDHNFNRRRQLKLDVATAKSELDNLQEEMKVFLAKASTGFEYKAAASNTKARQQELDAHLDTNPKWKGYRSRELSLTAQIRELESEASNLDYNQRNRLAAAMERLADGVFALVALHTLKKEG